MEQPCFNLANHALAPECTEMKYKFLLVAYGYGDWYCTSPYKIFLAKDFREWFLRFLK